MMNQNQNQSVIDPQNQGHQTNLTHDSVRQILAGNTELKPFLQVLLISTKQDKNQHKKKTMILSDGSCCHPFSYTVMVEKYLEANNVGQNSIVQVTDCLKSQTKSQKNLEKSMMIIIGLRVCSISSKRIGDPKMLKMPSDSSVTPQILNKNSNPQQQMFGMNKPQQQFPPQQKQSFMNQQSKPNLQGPQQQNQQLQNQQNQFQQKSMFNQFHEQQQQKQQFPLQQQQLPNQTYPQSNFNSNRAPYSSSNSGEETLVSIPDLSPYHRNWKITARVTEKSDLRTWTKGDKTGIVFNVNLADKEGEIKLAFFGDQANKYFNVLQTGKCYSVTNGAQIKPANKKFSSLPNNFEITASDRTLVTEVDESTDELASQIPIPKISECERIANIPNYATDAQIDVMGVVIEKGNTTDITTNKGKDTQRRNAKIADLDITAQNAGENNTSSFVEIGITFWGKQCALLDDIEIGDCVLIKKVRTSNFNEHSLSSSFSTKITKKLETLFPPAQELHSIWKQHAANNEANIRTLTQERENGLGMIGKSKYPRQPLTDLDEIDPHDKTKNSIVTKVYLSLIWGLDSGTNNAAAGGNQERSSLWYEACKSCNKKVKKNPDNTYRCDSCSQVTDTCNYKYMIRVQVSDHTDSRNVTLFGKSGEQLAGMPAEQLAELKENDPEQFAAVLKDLYFKEYEMRISVQENMYNDKAMIKYNAIYCYPIDFSKQAKKNLYDLDRYNTQSNAN